MLDPSRIDRPVAPATHAQPRPDLSFNHAHDPASRRKTLRALIFAFLCAFCGKSLIIKPSRQIKSYPPAFGTNLNPYLSTAYATGPLSNNIGAYFHT